LSIAKRNLELWNEILGYQATRAVDPDSLNPDPVSAFQVNPDPDTDPIQIQGFNDKKLKIKIQQNFVKSFFE
jgi:hypothetical protein